MLDHLEPTASQSCHTSSCVIQYGANSTPVPPVKQPRVDDSPGQMPLALMITHPDVIPCVPMQMPSDPTVTNFAHDDLLFAESYGVDVVAFDAMFVDANSVVANDVAAY